jgi:hypothetical protein
MNSRLFEIAIILILSTSIVGCGQESKFPTQSTIENQKQSEDIELVDDSVVSTFACAKASDSQISFINKGNAKKDVFLQECARQTGGSAWCAQLIRPNPSSISTFRCTYGNDQVHQLIHPHEGTWKNAFEAVRLVQELEQKGLRVCQIYNWWRPEPYNANVGGAAGRHPFAASVDVRFCSNADANRGFDELCKLRRKGRLRAIGHYGTSALHFGVGDKTANTWGRTCSN